MLNLLLIYFIWCIKIIINTHCWTVTKLTYVWCVLFFAPSVVFLWLLCVYLAHFIFCFVLTWLLLCWFYPCTNSLLFFLLSPHKLSVVFWYVVSLSFTKRQWFCVVLIFYPCTNCFLYDVVGVYPCTNRLLSFEFGFILEVNSNTIDVI